MSDLSVPPLESDPPPQPPEEPDFDACCGNGCDPCIFDTYALEQDRYRTELRAWQARQAAREASGKAR